MHQGQPCLQSAGCARRDLGYRAAKLHLARARTGERLRRGLARHRRRRRGVMPDLLLEFFSEEIPARMQARAAEDLHKLVTDKLVAAGLVYDGAKAFVTPRRLTLAVQGIPARQAERIDKKKGPPVSAKKEVIDAFLTANNFTSTDQLEIHDLAKGKYYVAPIVIVSRPS